MQDSPEKFVVTNVRIYKQIADEAYEKMSEALNAGRRPKTDGSEGWIITPDPHQTSFKQAMVSIVFTGIWLEALLHLLIVQAHGEQVFEEYDRKKSYEDKLRKVGFDDQELLECVGKFRKARKCLVHEKAYSDTTWETAQDAAENSHRILTALHGYFSRRAVDATHEGEEG